MKEREVCVCVCVCVCVRVLVKERERDSVCVRQTERVREKEFICAGKSVQCVYVTVSENSNQLCITWVGASSFCGVKKGSTIIVLQSTCLKQLGQWGVYN